MVAYDPQLHRSAERELDGLPDDDRARLTRVIQDVAQERQPTTHEKVRMLEGQRGLFRIRAGDSRAIATLDKPALKVLKVGQRDTVYDGVDDVDDRLEVSPSSL